MVWDGTAWTAVTIPNVGSGANTLSDVSCVSTIYCVAVGTYDNAGTQASLAMLWDGTAWTAVTSPSVGEASELIGVSCVSATFCTAVGLSYVGEDVPVLVMLWDGTSWSVLSGGTAGISGGLTSVSCDSESTCMAAGQTGWPSVTLTVALTETAVEPVTSTTTAPGTEPLAPAFTG